MTFSDDMILPIEILALPATILCHKRDDSINRSIRKNG